MTSVIKYLNKDKDRYTIIYLEKYGEAAGIDTFSLPSIFKTGERLYKKCLDEGKRWEDIVKIPENAIL